MFGGLMGFAPSPERQAMFPTFGMAGGAPAERMPGAIGTNHSARVLQQLTPQVNNTMPAPAAPQPAPAMPGGANDMNYTTSPTAPVATGTGQMPNWGQYVGNMMGNGVPQMANNLVNRMPMMKPMAGQQPNNVVDNMFARFSANPMANKYIPGNFLSAFSGQAFQNMPRFTPPGMFNSQPGWYNMANNLVQHRPMTPQIPTNGQVVAL